MVAILSQLEHYTTGGLYLKIVGKVLWKNPILAETLSKNGCTLLYFGIKILGNMNHVRNLSKNS